MVNKYYSDIINLTELVEYINKRIDRNKVKVNMRQDYDVRAHDFIVCGAFNPYFETESVDIPIEIDIICNTIDADISYDEIKEILDEFNLVLRHELIHLEQYVEDRFDFDDIEANEKEAYEREKKAIPWYRNITYKE